MEYKATLRYLHITPRKVRRVADAIRSKSVITAQELLKFLPQRPARPLAKLVGSAAANARERDGASVESLNVRHIRVEEGPRSKRFIPRAMGRAAPIQKRTSHVTVVLDSGEQESRRRVESPLRREEAAPTPFTEKTASDRPKFRATPLRESSALKKRFRIRDFGRRVFQRKAV